MTVDDIPHGDDLEPWQRAMDSVMRSQDRGYRPPKACKHCGSTTGCAADTGWPCTAERAKAIEDNHYQRTIGTTDLSARGYRSFWD